MSIGEMNKSNETNFFKRIETNSLGEKESLNNSLRKDDTSEKCEKTAENQKNEIHLSEKISATAENVCNNVGLVESKTDNSKPVSTEAMDTVPVDNSEDTT